ncbi:MAG: membrane dipeptidase [Planctomycetes bacterium]|nr:membrane dipeptidase [Planctomycetota bacterium]
MSDAQLHTHARDLLAAVPLIDGHNDAPWQYRRRVSNDLDAMDFAHDLSHLDPPMQTDLPRLRAGGVGAQFWSVYIPIRERGGRRGDARIVIEQIDLVKQLAERFPDDLEMAYTADDIERIHGGGRIACLAGMEGGHSIENSLAVLRALYDVGARYMTITHSKTLDWADSATDDAVHGGLTEFGEAVIREMNRLGMLVDLSHVSADTMRDAIAVARAPVIFSHSSAFSVCRHVRNVPDDVLEMTRDNDGVVMVTFLSYYVSEELRQHGEQLDAERWRLRKLHEDDEDAFRRDLGAWRESNPAPRCTIAQVADHIDHVRDVAGIDHIGIGSDYDGTSALPEGLGDVSTYPALVVELLRRGYSDDDMKKILGLNVLRVMREAERVAAHLRRTEPPGTAQAPPPES